LKLYLPHFIPINKVENKVPEKMRADFFKKSKRLISYEGDELLIKLKIHLNIRRISSINKGIEPINFETNKIKNKLVYIMLSLRRIEGVFLL
jgi:hypothetical protein